MRPAVLLLSALLLSAPASAQSSSAGQAVAALKAVKDFYGTFATRDAKTLRGLLIPEGRASTLLRDQDGKDVRWMSLPLSRLSNDLPGYPEGGSDRLIDPEVRVHDKIAMVWTRFEHFENGRFSHCGVSHFDLVHYEGSWRINNLTWIQQTKGCPGR